MMLFSRAEVQTDSAARYLGQVCAHFSHKAELEVVRPEENTGVIRFPSGLCSLTATGHALYLEVGGRDQFALERLQDVIDKHLQRFAFREPPVIAWRPLEG
jgi:hypothetical protein